MIAFLGAYPCIASHVAGIGIPGMRKKSQCRVMTIIQSWRFLTTQRRRFRNLLVRKCSSKRTGIPEVQRRYFRSIFSPHRFRRLTSFVNHILLSPSLLIARYVSAAATFASNSAIISSRSSSRKSES